MLFENLLVPWILPKGLQTKRFTQGNEFHFWGNNALAGIVHLANIAIRFSNSWRANVGKA